MILKSLCSSRPGGRWIAGLVAVMLAAGVVSGQAQWLTQTNVLKPGWTAVYLNVDASSQTLDSLVGFNPACPIDQIWFWKTLPSTAQYISTPASPLAGSSEWLAYYRPGAGSVSTFFSLAPNTERASGSPIRNKLQKLVPSAKTKLMLASGSLWEACVRPWEPLKTSCVHVF